MKRIMACFLALVLAFCTVGAMAAGRENKLVVGSTTALSGNFFSPAFGSNTSDLDVQTLLHGYHLAKWNGDEGSYVLNDRVVTSLVKTEDSQGNRTYTLTLCEDLRYSDGTPITARDYAFSILLNASAQMAEIGGAADGGACLLGAADYKDGAKALKGVRVLNDSHLAITVSAEYRPFFYELGLLDYAPYPVSVIAPGCQVKDDGEGAYIDGAFTADVLRGTMLDAQTGYVTHPSVVSGMYTLVSYDGAQAEFELNRNYKLAERDTVPIKRIVFKTVSNDTMIDELKNGTVDLLTKVTSASAVEQGNKLPYAYAKVSYPRTGLSMISFCCESSAVSSQAVRQAIAYCTDRDAIVSSYVGANGQRVDGYYGVGQWVYQLVSGKMAAPVARVINAASDEEKAAYNATMADWNSLSLANVATYAVNLDAAKALLDQDGWALNADGIREKLVGDQTVQLKLSLVYPEGNTIADALQAHMVENLAQVGIELTLQAKPMAELLKLYYRQEARDCDMIYLATNFSVCFDPSATFSPDDAAQGVSNRTAIADEELYQLAKDMSSTVPGDLLGYCRKWIAFQERYAEILPAIPVYSNNYNDYYTKRLKSFKVSERVSWAEAIEDAYRDDVQP